MAAPILHGPLALLRHPLGLCTAGAIVGTLGVGFVTSPPRASLDEATAADLEGYQDASQIGGSLGNLAVVSNGIAMAWGARVAQFEVADDEARFEARSDLLPGKVRDVVSDNDTLYASIHNLGVVQMGSPAAISPAPSDVLLALPDVGSLAVRGGEVVVVDRGTGELVSFDLAAGAANSSRRYALDTDWATTRRRVRATLVTAGDNGVFAAVFEDMYQESQLVVLKSSPGTPLSVLASFTATQPIVDLAVHGDVMYAVERYATVHALQLDDSPLLTPLGTFAPAEEGYAAGHLAVDNDGVAVVINPIHTGVPRLELYGGPTPWSGPPILVTSLAQEPAAGDIVLTSAAAVVSHRGLTVVPRRDEAAGATHLPLLGLVRGVVLVPDAVYVLDALSQVWCAPRQAAVRDDWSDMRIVLPNAGPLDTAAGLLVTAEGARGLRVWKPAGTCGLLATGALSTEPYVLQNVVGDGDRVIGITTRTVRGAERQAILVADVRDDSVRQIGEVVVDLERVGWLSYTALAANDGLVAIAAQGRGVYFVDAINMNATWTPFEPGESVASLVWGPNRHMYLLGVSSTSIQAADVTDIARPVILHKRTAYRPLGAVGMVDDAVVYAETDPVQSSVLRLLDRETFNERQVIDLPDGIFQPEVIKSAEEGVYVAVHDVGLMLVHPSQWTVYCPAVLNR